MNVLVVDDSAVLRKRLVQMVAEANTRCRVTQAASAVEALKATKESTPDVVVLDVRMPGGGALRALKKFKELTPSPRVIVLTNEPSSSTGQKYLAEGADRFLDKSLQFSMVPELLRLWMPPKETENARHG